MRHELPPAGWADAVVRERIAEYHRDAERESLAHQVREGRARSRASGGPEAAIRALQDQGMPAEEITAILETDDPELVGRYLELHHERMEEAFADQRRSGARAERLIAEAIADGRSIKTSGLRPGC